LKQEFPDLGEVEWATKPRRVPNMLSVAEVQAVLAQLDGTRWLMARCLFRKFFTSVLPRARRGDWLAAPTLTI
jgi:hypothetical protein